MNNRFFYKICSLLVTSALVSPLCGMQENYLQFLPKELLQKIATEAVLSQVGFTYDLAKTLDVGSPVTSLAYSPTQSIFASGSKDGIVRLFSSNAGVQMQQFTSSKGAVNSVAFSPDGKTVLSGTSEGIVYVWDIFTGKEILQFKAHQGPVFQVAFSPDGHFILTAGVATARLWDSKTGEQIKDFRGKHAGPLTSAVFTPDGKAIITGSRDKTARLWDIKTGAEVQQFRNDNEGLADVTSVVVSTDGKTVLTGSREGKVRLWNVESGQLLKEFKTDTASGIKSVALSFGGETVLAGTNNRKAYLWDRETGTVQQVFNAHRNDVNSVIFSPRSIFIITGSEDGTIAIWKRSDELSKKKTEEAKDIFIEKRLDVLSQPQLSEGATE